MFLENEIQKAFIEKMKAFCVGEGSNLVPGGVRPAGGSGFALGA